MKEDHIDEFHIPDTTWSVWNVESYQDYKKRFFVKGKFHDKVPEIIINEYKIVERLLCYSYYHYPLLDEVFSKATRVFESSIKYRIIELFQDQYNKIKNLDTLIKKLKPYTTSRIFNQWRNAKNLRNIYAHPVAGSNSGIVSHRAHIPMINCINNVFLSKEFVQYNEQELKKLENGSSILKDKIFVFEKDNKRFLVFDIRPVAFFRKEKGAYSLWTLYPVLKSFPQKDTDELIFNTPFCISMSNVELFNDRIEGIDLSSSQSIKLNMTEKNENILKYESFIRQIDSSDNIVKEIYLHSINNDINYEFERFLYYYCW